MSEPLFDLAQPKRVTAGSRRHGLEADLKRARDQLRDLSAAGVASLRRLAHELDRFAPQTAYERVALAQLQHQFDDTYARVFGMGPAAIDPIDQLLTEIRAAPDPRRSDPAQ